MFKPQEIKDRFNIELVRYRAADSTLDDDRWGPNEYYKWDLSTGKPLVYSRFIGYNNNGDMCSFAAEQPFPKASGELVFSTRYNKFFVTYKCDPVQALRDLDALERTVTQPFLYTEHPLYEFDHLIADSTLCIRPFGPNNFKDRPHDVFNICYGSCTAMVVVVATIYVRYELYVHLTCGDGCMLPSVVKMLPCVKESVERLRNGALLDGWDTKRAFIL